MNKPLILAMEDDAPIRNLIVTTLKTNDYRYRTATNGGQAILEASTHSPDTVLLDLGLPDMDGIEVIRNIRPGLICLLLSSVPGTKTGIK